ncbi:MAG: TetR/AcrR family transcriptional regulator [Bacteroidales bacterium]|nr:TetR/AcrR family transcriptional regulator [Bacteroidales bacterium]MBN2751025.1 TetR/AcrR family transcriptional regulator [Bacteroidales bacterium]
MAPQRDKEQTMQRLIDAVGTIIGREGFRNIGVNTVAKEADVDKVLIYRYFGGLDGLLKAYAYQKDFWLNIDKLFGDIEPERLNDMCYLKEITKQILHGQLTEMRANKELQEILIWELVERNNLTAQLAADREEKGTGLTRLLSGKLGIAQEVEPLIAIVIAGVTYLALRSRSDSHFNGVNISSADGWGRIEEGLNKIVDLYFESLAK